MEKPELAADQVGVESEVLRTLALLRRSFGFLVTLKAEGGLAELHVSIFARGDFSLEFLPNRSLCWVASVLPWRSKSKLSRSS